MRVALAVTLAMLSAPAVQAQTATEPALMVYAAGSATGALTAILDAYRKETGRTVDLKTGPAGLMRERIEQGDQVDLFVSANVAHPNTLHAEHLAGPVAIFARNRMCATARHEIGMTTGNMLDRLLDPKVRIGTSTPGADPGGDYAQMLFDRAETVRPGATAVLKAKARAIVGSRIETATARAANALAGLDQGGVDVTIGYCSSRSTSQDASVDKVPVPDALAIPVAYGMTVVTTSANPAREAAARQVAAYLLRPSAQHLLTDYGFLPAHGAGGITARNRGKR